MCHCLKFRFFFRCDQTKIILNLYSFLVLVLVKYKYDLYPSDGVVCCRTWATEGAMKLNHFDSSDLNNDLSSTRHLNYIHIYLDIASIYLNQITVPKV